ncbi:Osb3 protein [Thalictrum thalictroides]|uniref:Osb3 protein n=1 Tax=Thalictrum thalictroides TaxID=46969 RepID=A0A7J6W7G6_THATH|nr:Osb3 protein [Thalictrum thalictroides]
MNLSRILSEALTSSSSPPSTKHRFFHSSIFLQFSNYSTTSKSKYSYARKKQSQSSISEPQDLNPQPPPPPPSPSAQPPVVSQSSNHFQPNLRNKDVNKIDGDFLKPKAFFWQAKKVVNTDREWQKPSEIPYQAKAANSVNLIGYVGMPVQFKASLDGKPWAGTVLTQQKVSDTNLWIPVIFEGDLAHVAACHLKEKDFVHVAGQLTGDPPQFTTDEGQSGIQVMVHSLSFVQEALQRKECETSYEQREQVTSCSSSSSTKDSVTIEPLWTDLLANPHKWWDNRLNKNNPTDADFEHMDNGGKLWIDDSTPEWIVSKVESLNFIKKIVEKSQKNDSQSLYWRDYIDNPDRWWDNRKDKLSGRIKPKSPDFKHKDTGVALWLVSAPGWVQSKFDELKADNTVNKPSQQADSKDDPWKSLVEKPDKWWDNRSKKMNPKSPDFKHKETGEALWLNKSPAWVSDKLPPVKI